MRKFLKRGFAALLGAAMVVSVLPQFPAGRASAAVTEDADTSSDETAGKFDLKDGEYLIPFELETVQGSGENYSWDSNNTDKGLRFSLDRYVTVKAENGTYNVEFELWNAGELGITAVQAVTDKKAASDADAAGKAKLDADALEGDLDKESVDSLISEGYAATGTAVNIPLKKGSEDRNLMTSFSYSTKDLKNVIVLIGTVTDGIQCVRLTLDTDSAITLGEGNKYSLVCMNYGTSTSSLENDENIVQRAVFNRSAEISQTDTGFKAVFNFRPVSVGSESVDSLYLIKGSAEAEYAFQKGDLPNGAPEKNPDHFKKIEVSDGKAQIDFEGLNRSLYVRMYDSSSSNDFKVCRVRLVKATLYKNSISDSTGSITLKSDNSSVNDYSVSVKKQDEKNPPEWIDKSLVPQTMTLASQGKYDIYTISLKDKDGNAASFSGLGTIKLPDDADPSDYVVYEYMEAMGFKLLTQGNVNSYEKDGKLCIDGTVTDGMKLVVFKKVKLFDIRDLDDGCYKVRVTLWNAGQNAQSMAAAVVKPEAYLAVKNDRYYLQFNVRKAVILGLPAFMTRCYAVNVKKERRDVLNYYKPASTVAVHDDREVNDYIKSVLRENLEANGSIDKDGRVDTGETDENGNKIYESFDEYADRQIQDGNSGYLQNNLHYLQTLSLDVTDSIIKSGLNKYKIDIAFSSDTMDTLYNGLPGSDNGLNEAALMVSEPEPDNDITLAQIRGEDKAVTADKSDLQKYFDEMHVITANRNNHSDYNSLIPAWSEAYLAYTKVDSTQGDVDKATEDLKTALGKTADISEYNNYKNNRISKRDAEEKSYEKYSEVRNETADIISSDGLTQEQADKAAADLKAAYEAVLPSESYKEFVKKSISRYESRDLSSYSTKSINRLKDAIEKAKKAVAEENINYADLDEAYSDMSDAGSRLYKKAADGKDSELLSLVKKASAIDTSPYTEESANTFKEALAAAQEVADEPDKSEIEIKAAVTPLRDAIEGLRVFEDGTYNVPVSLYKSNEDSVSMGNAALVQTAKLKAKDGKYKLTFRFKKMKFSGMEGYLMTFSTLSDISCNDAGVPVKYSTTPADVKSTYDAVDKYNSEDSSDEKCAGKKYPKDLSIDVDGIEEYVPAEVYVPVMGSLASGTQVCRLKIDYSKAVKYNSGDIEREESLEEASANLDSALTAAKAVIKDIYTEETYKTFDDAFAEAQAVRNDSTADADKINAAAEKLNEARNNLKKKLDTSDLKDGTYTVNFTMVNASDPSKNSMSDNAVEKPLTVSVKDGKYTAYVDFKGMKMDLGGREYTGYLKELSYFDGKDYVPVTVVSTFNVTDEYNDADGDGTPEFNYPERMSFPLVNKDKGDQDGYVKAEVFVPVMESISKGSGTQKVLIKIDWNSIKVSDTNPIETEKPDATVTPSAKPSETEKPHVTETPSETEKPGTLSSSAPLQTNKPVNSAASAAAASATKTAAQLAKGTEVKVDGNMYRITKEAGESGKGEAALVKAVNKKKVTVPGSVKPGDGRTYNVTSILKGAFAGKKIRTVTLGKNVKKIAGKAFSDSSAVKLIVKTKKLTKASVKNALRSSKIKTVKIKIGSKKDNKKFVKKYSKIFTKKNSGKKVKVK